MQRRLFWQFLSLFVLAVSLLAQQPIAPAIPTTGFAGLDQYRASRIAVFTDDYGQLQRYRADDASVKTMSDSKNRVIFFGDSITDGWKLDKYFEGKSYINRGIGGQTTPQMLVRFRQDVIDLKPKVLVILAGTNDIAGNTGPVDPVLRVLQGLGLLGAAGATLAVANAVAVWRGRAGWRSMANATLVALAAMLFTVVGAVSGLLNQSLSY